MLYYSRLRPDEYNKLAAKILIMFPTESMGTYYVPAVRRAESAVQKSVMAKGKLVDKVRNLIYRCEEAVPRRKRKASKPATVIQDSHSDTNLQNEDILWLQINVEPWEEVLQKWEDTYTIRREDKTETVMEFLEHWSILKKINNDVLVCSYIYIRMK